MSEPTLAHLLKDAVETARATDVALEYQQSASTETESESIELAVRFGETEPQSAICLTRLLELLAEHANVGSMDVIGPPGNQVVVNGARGNENFKIVFSL